MLVYTQAIEGAAGKHLFEEVYGAYCGRLLTLAHRRLPERQDAEDAVHQAFLALAEHFDRLSRLPRQQLEAYLVVVTERKCIDLLRQRGLKLSAIQETISRIDPLPGAKDFLDALRKDTQVVILSDTFDQFAMPLMAKLGYPTLLCNTLEVDGEGYITRHLMRCEHSKLTTVKALQSIGYDTIASGDSYNDLEMILHSKAGFLFRGPDKIKQDYPDLPAFEDYGDLLAAIRAAL